MLRPHAVRPCMLPPMQVNLPAGRCEHEGCIVFALPGYQWQNRRFSNRHLLLGMVSSHRLLALIAACTSSVAC